MHQIDVKTKKSKPDGLRCSIEDNKRNTFGQRCRVDNPLIPVDVIQTTDSLNKIRFYIVILIENYHSITTRF